MLEDREAGRDGTRPDVKRGCYYNESDKKRTFEDRSIPVVIQPGPLPTPFPILRRRKGPLLLRQPIESEY